MDNQIRQAKKQLTKELADFKFNEQMISKVQAKLNTTSVHTRKRLIVHKLIPSFMSAAFLSIFFIGLYHFVLSDDFVGRNGNTPQRETVDVQPPPNNSELGITDTKETSLANTDETKESDIIDTDVTSDSPIEVEKTPLKSESEPSSVESKNPQKEIEIEGLSFVLISADNRTNLTDIAIKHDGVVYYNKEVDKMALVINNEPVVFEYRNGPLTSIENVSYLYDYDYVIEDTKELFNAINLAVETGEPQKVIIDIQSYYDIYLENDWINIRLK
ncbi:hypothetical protein V7111_26905 [Neobacillus niacini]|uniref:hypothetical protein n=1 Tax=Neobacillus niacini TaxID=86668 RepID=UPI0030022DC1